VLRVWANYFSSCVINVWNALPEEVVLIPSVNNFKKALDEYWSDFTFEALTYLGRGRSRGAAGAAAPLCSHQNTKKGHLFPKI